MGTEKFPDLKIQFDHLCEQKAELEKITDPLRERIDELEQKMHPYVVEQRQLADQLKEHLPRMAELDNQIGALARGMGARSIGGRGE